MFELEVIALLVACLLATSVSASNVIDGRCPVAKNDALATVYTTSRACPDVAVCFQKWCTKCINGTSDTVKGRGICRPRSTLTSCDDVVFCQRSLFLCFVGAASLSEKTGNNSCDTWGYDLHSQLLLYASDVSAPFALTDLYASCAAHACLDINNTVVDGLSCRPHYALSCPYPTIALNTPQDSTKRSVFYGSLNLPGDFAEVEATQQEDKLETAVLNDLRDVFVSNLIITYFRIKSASRRVASYNSILYIQFSMYYSSDDAASIANLPSVVKALTNSSAWLRSTVAALRRIDPNARIGTPTVSYSTLPPAPEVAPVDPFCTTKCFAAIAVGGAVVIVIMIVVYCFFCKAKQHDNKDNHKMNDF